MIIEKQFGNVTVTPVKKKTLKIELPDGQVRFSEHFTVKKGHRLVELTRSVSIGGKAFSLMSISLEQEEDLKAELAAYEQEKEKEIVDYMKSLDLNGAKTKSGRYTFLNRQDINSKISDFFDYDVNFTVAALREYAMSRYDKETSHDVDPRDGELILVSTYSNKSAEPAEDVTESTEATEPSESDKKRKELLDEMYDRAPSLTDEEFEDFYDLPRSRFLF